MRAWVRLGGEPLIFGFDPAELSDYLQPRGFTLVSDLPTAEAAIARNLPAGRSESGSRFYRAAVAGRR